MKVESTDKQIFVVYFYKEETKLQLGPHFDNLNDALDAMIKDRDDWHESGGALHYGSQRKSTVERVKEWKLEEVIDNVFFNLSIADTDECCALSNDWTEESTNQPNP